MTNFQNHAVRFTATMVAWALAMGVGVVGMSVAPATAQTCVANGDVDGSGDFTIGDITQFNDFVYAGFHGGFVAPYAADLVADGMIDIEDFRRFNFCFIDFCLFPPCCPGPMPVTSCDPLMIFSSNPARAVGAASVSYSDGTATVTNVGTSGNDGLRFYPNMGDTWRPQLHLDFGNVDISQPGRQVSIDFTRVDTTMDMEWAAHVAAVNSGDAVTLTLGLGLPQQTFLALYAYTGTDREYIGEFYNNQLELVAAAPANPLVITGATLQLLDAFQLTVFLDQAVSFTVGGQVPEGPFAADRLVLSAGSPYEGPFNQGPVVMTGAGMETFTLTYTGLCCVGKVGDANGSGEDEPTIGDISVMIDAKFITGACISSGPGANIRCLAEADINQSGGVNPTCDDITIGDISLLIDGGFITGWDFFLRSPCLYPD